MKILYPKILILLFLFVSSIALCQSGWIQQNSGITTSLNSVHFENSQRGWCAGNEGKILKTTNGGSNWIQQVSGFGISLESISFTNVNTGYCVGDSSLVLKTINGGNNWFRLNLNAANNFTSVIFINDTVGFICGNYIHNATSKLYKTTNGGISFDSVISGSSQYNSSVSFINSMTGWILGLNDVISNWFVSKTTNGGSTWQAQITFTDARDLNSIFFIDSLNGWFASPLLSPPYPYSTIYRTTNGGTNWITADTCESSELSYGLFFYNNRKGWSSTRGNILSTSDGGMNWLRNSVPRLNIIYRSVYFTDSLTGWTVGDSGTILKTTSGGVLTNFTNQSSEIPDNYSLDQNYPNPFNPTTKISYTLPNTQYTLLKVYDILGNEIATLVNQKQNEGQYQVEFDGSNLPSGIYLYRLESNGNIIDTKRMILLK